MDVGTISLVLLVQSWRRVAIAVTAFTVSHSITLVATSLGYIGLPQRPVEALIALSICLAIAVTVQYRLHRAPEYGLTIIWALVGVIVANWQPLNVAVAGLAVVGIVAILALRGTDTE